MKKVLFLISVGVLFFLKIEAQVSGVKLMIKAQTTANKYNIYAIVTQGSATTTAQRVSFASTVSILVPTGAAVSVDSVFNPVKSIGSPAWSMIDLLFNPIPSDSTDYYQFYSDPSPQAFYPVLALNDTIRLFSVNIKTGSALCKNKIRLYQNSVDPSSSNPVMGGRDFKNGIYISSGIANDYQGLHIIPQSYKVITTNNDGIGSLRRACNCAVDGSQIDIEVPQADTINLETTLMITKNLVIKGKYINNRIKKNVTTPIFDIAPAKTVLLQDVDLVIKPSSAVVRGIHNKGTLILNNVMIRDQGLNSSSGTTILNEGVITITGQTKILKS